MYGKMKAANGTVAFQGTSMGIGFQQSLPIGVHIYILVFWRSLVTLEFN